MTELPLLTVQPAVTVDRPAAPVSGPSPSLPVRYAGLDGLRAFAVAVVMIYHLFPGVLPGGFIGVDVFFVISGFLITSLLVRERRTTDRIDLRRFWVRRARRLLPAIALLVIVCSTVALALGGDVLVGLPRQILGAFTFSANWLSIAADSSYFAQGAPELFRNLWSLAVEEQFYLVWPLILLALALIRHWWARFAIVLAAAAASAIWMAVLYVPGEDPTRVYFGSDTHSFGLALGAALALLVVRMRPLDLDAGESALQTFVRRGLGPLGALSVLGLVVCAYAMTSDADFTYRGGLALVSVLSAVAIWAAIVPRSSLGRTLDLAPLRFVGARSYGLYLWHWPVFVLACAFVPDENEPIAAVLVGVGSLAVTGAAALLSYRYLEQPIRKHGLLGALRRARVRMQGSRPTRIAGIAGTAVAGLLVAGTVAAMALAPAATSAQRMIEQGAASLDGPGHGASPSAPPTHLRIPPDPHPIAKGPDISAFGDSVMLASAPALQETYPGIAVDAVVSRQMSKAPEVIAGAAASGGLRDVVVLGLGTNGSISATTLDAVLDAIGPRRHLVLVNVQAPRSWADGVNATLDRYAADHPGRVVVADWKGAIAGHLDLLADDQIHPGHRGGLLYAEALGDALHTLAERSTVRPANPWDKAGPRPQ
ncbi:acyltransferase family protein [Leifsonia aquatica]|uniref:Peptidoglycan/LPS O-acetylase OafA/YrhL n=1 Tax=Leifsonia aquatica TaxID=144185 RepID=A0A7W4YLI1_LEIAQ|nr:acyltransferase family protein [Leifsonia aquatica]MBB2969080.1 peptidoglycan/LPS O-acetylase OafA/YrhL [Leifsonia aquatica]